jgi:hypothetical protein
MDEAPLSPAEVAKLRAEAEESRHECELLRREATRLAAINRALDGKLRVAEADRDRLQAWTGAVEHSAPWRIIQFLRSLVGRKW